jgi:hypothetical protein
MLRYLMIVMIAAAWRPPAKLPPHRLRGGRVAGTGRCSAPGAHAHAWLPAPRQSCIRPKPALVDAVSMRQGHEALMQVAPCDQSQCIRLLTARVSKVPSRLAERAITVLHHGRC